MDDEKFQRQMDLIAERQAKFDEQFQRHVNFMLAQQAKFDERQAKFDERMSRLEQQTRENREDIAKLVNVVMSLATHVERHDQEIAALIERGKEVDRRFEEVAKRFRETDERFRESEERVNALIILAERYFNQNGK